MTDMVALTVQLTDANFSDLLRVQNMLSKARTDLNLAELRDCARIVKALQTPLFIELVRAAGHVVATNAATERDWQTTTFELFFPISDQESTEC